MNTKHLLLATLLAGAFVNAMASTATDDASAAAFFEFDSAGAGEHGGAADDARPRSVVRERVGAGDFDHLSHLDHSSFTGPLMFNHGRAVKGAPYSAEVVNEQQHNLADGNQIVNRTSSMSYRDSAGRTRQEMRDASGAARAVTIHDPVEGVTYILRPAAKTATKIASRHDIARLAGEHARLAGEKARMAAEHARIAGEKARERGEQLRRQEGEQVIVKRIERSDGEAGHRIHEDVRIRVARDIAAGQPMPGMDRFGPMIAGAFGDMKWAAKATTKELGMREIGGVKAEGKLRSYEIPAGEIGNRNPIVVSTETWYSPELQVTLLSRRSDPRSGERIYRLEDVKREEPAAALFAVPSDYTVKDTLKAMERKK